MRECISGFYIPFQIIVYLLIFIVGSFGLIKCCDIFLDNTSKVAKKIQDT